MTRRPSLLLPFYSFGVSLRFGQWVTKCQPINVV